MAENIEGETEGELLDEDDAEDADGLLLMPLLRAGTAATEDETADAEEAAAPLPAAYMISVARGDCAADKRPAVPAAAALRGDNALIGSSSFGELEFDR